MKTIAVHTDDLQLRFVDTRRPDSHTVAADVLAQSLEAFQRLVSLVAMRQEGRTPGQRVRPSVDIQARYRLVCDLPKLGSFLVPVRIEGADLLSIDEISKVMPELSAVLRTAGNNDDQAFNALVSDDTWRRFYIDAIGKLVPKQSTGIELEVKNGSQVLLNTDAARKFVEQASRSLPIKSARGAIIGEFKRIDFSKREITIRHQKTAKDLTCIYETYVEESLLEHPRDLLLVFGSVTRDSEGRPISIEDVDHIEPIDLEPETIPEFVSRNQLVSPKEVLLASVSFDENDVVYVASISALGISVFAENRAALSDALVDELSLLWRRYAIAPDDKLTRAAQALKNRILDSFIGVLNAP